MKVDAVIVGARRAGAATAFLLARAMMKGTTAAFADYETTRDNLSRRLFEITELRVQIRTNDGTTVLEGEAWC